MKNEYKYKKSALIKSDRYLNRKDLIGAILSDDKLYSLEEVDKAIEDYFKRSVK